MSHDRAAAKAQNLENLSWEGETVVLEKFSDIHVAPVIVPIFNGAFAPNRDATRVHSGQVAEIAGAWVSGVQSFDVKSAADLKWHDGYYLGYDFHRNPELPEENLNKGGASTFLVPTPQDAELFSEVYWEMDEPDRERHFDDPNYEALPMSPKGLKSVYLPSDPVENSGRIFMSREDALEDARILASLKDLGNDEAMRDMLESARPTPAFDMLGKGKSTLEHISEETPLIAAAYMANLPSPRPLIAAAALSGAISGDDLRLAAREPSSEGDFRKGDAVHELRRAAHDRTDAIIVTAAGKTLREKANDPDAMIGALTKLEKVAMKIGNAGVVGMVLNATEDVMVTGQPAKRKPAEHQL